METESLAMEEVRHRSPGSLGELSSLLRQIVFRIEVFEFVEMCV
jgi:hypothetical protein